MAGKQTLTDVVTAENLSDVLSHISRVQRHLANHNATRRQHTSTTVTDNRQRWSVSCPVIIISWVPVAPPDGGGGSFPPMGGRPKIM